MYFIYRLVNLVERKCYVSYQESDDIFWCNPICRLSDLHENKLNRRMHLPKNVMEDVKKHGAHNFSIEAIRGTPYREEAIKLLDQIVTPAFRENPNNYNRPLGRKKAKYD